MISAKHRCLLVHVPRTGGTSIERFFLKLNGLDWASRSPLLLRANLEPSRGPEFLAHLRAEEYVQCGHVVPADWASYFKFAFVRNPWDRLVSEYRWNGHDRNCSFKDYVLGGLPFRSAYSDAWRHLMPQYDYLHDADGRMLVDFVGRFETLQSDFETVCLELGIGNSKLPHTNKSASKQKTRRLWNRLPGRSAGQGKSYREFYDAELVEAVSKMYQKDIEAFGYAWE